MMLIMMSVMLTMYLSLQGLLLMMLFLCSLPVAYVVVGLKPSWQVLGGKSIKSLTNCLLLLKTFEKRIAISTQALWALF